MCNEECLRFASRHLRRQEVDGKDVLEVGARVVQQPELSLRGTIEALRPRSYLGVDIEPGPGVDEVCPAEELASRYGDASFDLVVCTEVLEHVENWRTVVSNLKQVLRPSGVLLVTTRSRGFPYHGFPHDHWRYEPGDMRAIFSDLEIAALEDDRSAPGVLLKALKPAVFEEVDLTDYRLYSVSERTRTSSRLPPPRSAYVFVLRAGAAARAAYRAVFPEAAREVIRRHLIRRSWYASQRSSAVDRSAGDASRDAR